VAEAAQSMRDLMAEVWMPDFEIEAACNTLMVLTRVLATEVQIDSEATVLALAQRFAVSRATCDLLCRAAHPNADVEAAIREAYASTCREAEQAISHTVGGAPREAVLALIAQGERTLNAKLLDLAWLTLEHIAARSPTPTISRSRQRRCANAIAVPARKCGSHRCRHRPPNTDPGRTTQRRQKSSGCAPSLERPGGRKRVKSSSIRSRLRSSRVHAFRKRCSSSSAHTPVPCMRCPKLES